MPLETATFIHDLVPTNPAHTDGLSAADSHLRLIKSSLQATFPNFTDVALASTQAQIDAVVTAAPAVVAYLVPPGAIMDFGSAGAPTGWLTCDGQAVSRTAFATLFAQISTGWGPGDGSTTFNVPNLVSRFRRHRDGGSLAGNVGNLQSPVNLQHTHPVNGNTGNDAGQPHTHDISHTTGAMNSNASHSHTVSGGTKGGSGTTFESATGVTIVPSNAADIVINPTNTDHTHSFTGSSGSQSALHTHAVNIFSGTGSADSALEARPYSATVLTCIKT